ncbi:MAG: hypothetical protein CM15mP111_0370 [Hyphomicrobiales bacterium]|nr:MAG: hypothetical protein CM15mP111_0370 [Hyphomicrobiales bacterium]
MKKSELIDQLAKDYPHLYHRDIEKVVDVFYNSISQALANGQRVELRGFGAFSTKERGPRIGRNPKTVREWRYQGKNQYITSLVKNSRNVSIVAVNSPINEEW